MSVKSIVKAKDRAFLTKCVKEIQAWHKTSILPEGSLTILAKELEDHGYCDPDAPDSCRMAEGLVLEAVADLWVNSGKLP